MNYRVRDILKGIDKTECEDPDGWWETSYGAKFGKDTLDELLAANEPLVERIQEYLHAGGLFNPEMMNHDKVRNLLIDIRNHLS